MRMTRRARAAGLVAALVVASAPGARADISGQENAAVIADSILEVPDTLVAAAVGGASHSRGIADSPLGGFPTHGSTFLVLSTGLAGSADDPDTGDASFNHGTTAAHPDPRPATDWKPADPAQVRDLTSFELTVRAPQGTTCLQFDTKFLSDEFGGTAVANDGLKVMLSATDANVAHDPSGLPVEVLSSLPTPDVYSAANAVGTTYDGATPTMTHTVPIGAGNHTLRFVLYDVLDGMFDSAVFVDHLTFGPNCFAALGTELAGPASGVVGTEADYTLTVTNPTAGDLPFDRVEVPLPPALEYVAGSTVGATSDEPALVGDMLSWSPGGQVPAGGSVSLGFSLLATEAVDTVLELTSRAGPNEGTTTVPVVAARGASRVTLQVARTRGKVKLSGLVSPAHRGTAVKVQLFRKQGGKFRSVAQTSTNLGVDSRFSASFRRPAAGACRAVATFTGSPAYEPSAVTKRFHC